MNEIIELLKSTGWLQMEPQLLSDFLDETTIDLDAYGVTVVVMHLRSGDENRYYADINNFSRNDGYSVTEQLQRLLQDGKTHYVLHCSPNYKVKVPQIWDKWLDLMLEKGNWHMPTYPAIQAFREDAWGQRARYVLAGIDAYRGDGLSMEVLIPKLGYALICSSEGIRPSDLTYYISDVNGKIIKVSRGRVQTHPPGSRQKQSQKLKRGTKADPAYHLPEGALFTLNMYPKDWENGPSIQVVLKVKPEYRNGWQRSWDPH